uniref:Uncharacterized protein n=1 Tax=Trichuris muris TaxID=70415 RepID=A0A5S6Q8L1_TRIMR
MPGFTTSIEQVANLSVQREGHRFCGRSSVRAKGCPFGPLVAPEQRDSSPISKPPKWGSLEGAERPRFVRGRKLPERAVVARRLATPEGATAKQGGSPRRAPDEPVPRGCPPNQQRWSELVRPFRPRSNEKKRLASVTSAPDQERTPWPSAVARTKDHQWSDCQEFAGPFEGTRAPALPWIDQRFSFASHLQRRIMLANRTVPPQRLANGFNAPCSSFARSIAYLNTQISTVGTLSGTDLRPYDRRAPTFGRSKLSTAGRLLRQGKWRDGWARCDNKPTISKRINVRNSAVGAGSFSRPNGAPTINERYGEKGKNSSKGQRASKKLSAVQISLHGFDWSLDLALCPFRPGDSTLIDKPKSAKRFLTGCRLKLFHWSIQLTNQIAPTCSLPWQFGRLLPYLLLSTRMMRREHYSSKRPNSAVGCTARTDRRAELTCSSSARRHRRRRRCHPFVVLIAEAR